MEVKEAIDLLPFDEIGSDYAVTALGDIVFGFECRMVEAYTMAAVVNDQLNNIKDSSINLFYHTWKLALNSLPDNTVVQKYNFYYVIPYERENGVAEYTKKWNEDLYTKRDVVLDKVFITVTFPSKGSTKITKRESLYKRVSRYKSDSFSIHEKREKFNDFYKSLDSSFESIKPMNGEDILGLTIKCWNNDVSDDQFMRDIKNEKSGIVVGESFISVLSSRIKIDTIDAFTSSNRNLIPTSDIGNNTNYYKDTNLPVSYLFPVGIGAPIDHVMIETIELQSKDDVEARLSKERGYLNPLRSFGVREAIYKQNQIDGVKELQAINGYRYAKWGVVLLIKGINEEQSKAYAKKIKDTASKSIGLALEFENFGAWKQFYYSLPGMGKMLTNLRLDFLEVLSYLTHIETFKRGNSDGIMLLDLFGKPFKQTLWKSKYSQSANGVIFGPTGQGKSVFVNHALDQCHSDGDMIYIVDVGGSYKRLSKMKKGIYIDSTPLSNLSFNPFMDCYFKDGEYYPELDDSGEQDPIYLDFMVSLILSCWFTDDNSPPKELPTLLRSMIKGYFYAFNKKEITGKLSFDSFYNYVSSMKMDDSYERYFDKASFNLILKKFTNDGDYNYLFNSEKPLDIKNRWVAFDLKGVNNSKDIQAPVTLMVMHLFQRMMVEYRGIKKRFWIDEAIDFLKSPVMASYIGSAYRKIRKEGGQIMIITQSIDYLDVLPDLTKSEILSNTDIKILLNHAGKENLLFDKIQKGLGFSEDEMELLNNQTPVDSSKYRIVMVKYGTQKGYLARIEISKKTWSLYQTEEKYMDMVDELLERYNSVELAVSEFLTKAKIDYED